MFSVHTGKRAAALWVGVGYAFLLASVLLYLDHSKATKLGPSLMQGIVGGFGILWLQIVHFLLTFTLVYAVAGWSIWWISAPALRKIAGSEREFGLLAFLHLLLIHLWIVLQAAYRFPDSLLGNSFSLSASEAGSLVRLALAFVICIPLVLGIGLRLAEVAVSKPPRRQRALLFTGLLITIIGIGISGWTMNNDDRPFPVDPNRPHVILIGIDGWRLDALPQNMGRRDVMPNMAAFIDASAWIERAVTPVARTYPAWWTILTGQNPKSHGVRFNLIPDERIKTGLGLPERLGELGYHRVFAMDERRFANIREDHGFDQVIGPAMGAADFVLGSLADTPLTNLLTNLPISRLLFPFNHMNRADYKTYEPASFDRALRRAVLNAPRQPMLLITHFELPHWPFRWASSPRAPDFGPEYAGDKAAYLAALQRTDQQFGALMDVLSASDVLENAVVVVLSDHGESMAVEDPFWRNIETSEARPVPAGHGNSVISTNQHLVPVAFRVYGSEPLESGIRKGTASLSDIYPTISDLLGFTTENTDGQSLLTSLRNPHVAIPARPIPLETGFNTESSAQGIFNAGRLFDEAAAYYDVLPNGLLQIKPDLVDELVKTKQRATITGTSLFMPLLPDDFRIGSVDAFIGDVTSGGFKVASLPNDDSQITELVVGFCQKFRNDGATNVDRFCASAVASAVPTGTTP